MSNLLKTGADWLAAKRKEHMTTTVVYRRGDESVSVQATKGRTEIEVEGDITLRTTIIDWLITAADLVLDGDQVEPQRGDLIEETIGDQTHTYEVLPIEREGPWRWSDGFGNTVRIHTKRTGVA